MDDKSVESLLREPDSELDGNLSWDNGEIIGLHQAGTMTFEQLLQKTESGDNMQRAVSV
jgi:hypothetical protein